MSRRPRRPADGGDVLPLRPPAPAEGAAEPAPVLDTAPEPAPALSPAGEAGAGPAPALEDDSGGAAVVDLAAHRRPKDAPSPELAAPEAELVRLMLEWGIDGARAELAWKRMKAEPPCPERVAVLPRVRPPGPGRESWAPAPTPDNLRAVFDLRPWRERLRWDDFALRVELRGARPGSAWEAWEDADHTPGIRADLSCDLGAVWSVEDVRAYALGAAKLTRWHPVREYLRGLRWDGEHRLWSWVPRYYGAPDTTLNGEIGARWMIAAVARVMDPGCKVDSVLTLAGPQGCGKSRSLAALAGAWFADSPLPIGEKDGAQNLRGRWIWELAELAAMQNRTFEAVKAYLSSGQDTYRPSYGREAVTVARQTVFCASVNPEQGARFLHDRTGNRRFWVVPVHRTPGAPVDVAGLEAERDQLWAEAFARFAAGWRWHLAPEQEAELAVAQEDAQGEVDAWAPLVGEWLSTRAPEWFTLAEAAEAAVKLDPSKLGARDASRLRTCLHDAGCRGNAVKRIHGVQVKGWRRPVGMGGEPTPEGGL